MEPDSFQGFLDAIDAHPTPVSEMIEVLKRKAPWETASEAVPIHREASSLIPGKRSG
jgi:hypothetical protein